MMDTNSPTSAIIQIPIFDRNLDIDTNLDMITINLPQIYEKVWKTSSLPLIGINEYVDDVLIPWRAR